VNASTARSFVLVSMFLIGGVVMYDVVKNKESLGADQSFRAVWSLALLFILLAILADTVPEIAGPFAGLVALSVVIGRKGVLAAIVGTGTGTLSPGLANRPDRLH